MEEDQEIDPLRRILLIDRGDMLADDLCDVRNPVWILPDLLEEMQIDLRDCWFIESIDDIGNCISLLVPKVHSSEPVQWDVNRISPVCGHTCELLHWGASAIRTKFDLSLNPLSALARDCSLRKLNS